MDQEDTPLELDDRTTDCAAPAVPSPPLLSTGELLGDLLTELAQRHERRQAGLWVGGMQTGVSLIDQYLRGLSPGRITVCNATTGLGKSTLANQIAYQVSAFAAQDACAVYASFENDPKEMVLKLLARLSGWPISSLEDGDVDPADPQLRGAIRQLGAVPLFYVRGNNLTTPTLLAERVKEAREQSGRQDVLLVYDYLQLGARFMPAVTAREGVGLTLAHLTAIAKEAPAHVWAIGSQNRETNKSGQPALHGGLESGAIEYDVNHLLVMVPGEAKQQRVLHIVKNRNGRQDEEAKLVYHGSRGYFEQEGDDGDRWAV